MMLGCSGSTRPLGDPDRWDAGECLAVFTLDHEDSPLTERQELGSPAGHPQSRVPAAEIDPERQRPVSAAAALQLEGRPIAWFSPGLDVVVLDAAAFAPLRTVDATRAPPDEPRRVGRVMPRARAALGERGVIELLLRAEVIQTYWHLGADLCLGAETTTDGTYRARLHGVHQYATNRLVDEALAFEVSIDAEDEITVTTRSPTP